jgi:hypothetical protein
MVERAIHATLQNLFCGIRKERHLALKDEISRVFYRLETYFDQRDVTTEITKATPFSPVKYGHRSRQLGESSGTLIASHNAFSSLGDRDALWQEDV